MLYENFLNPTYACLWTAWFLFFGVRIFFGGYLTVLKVGFGQAIGNRPLLIFVALLLLAGMQLFCFGLLAELLMRTYHESQSRPIYRVREVIASHSGTLTKSRYTIEGLGSKANATW